MHRFAIVMFCCLCAALNVGAFAQDPPPTTPPTAPPTIGKDKQVRNAARLIKQMDADSDGRVSRAEWTGKPEGFTRFDADKDGFVTREEFNGVIGSITGVDAGQGKAARNGLRKLDTNQDGKLARDEWRGRPRGFDKLDADNDGFLTTEELRQRAGKRKNRKTI